MKRVMIEADLEGISGISSMKEIQDRASEDYARACKRLMADVNAAIAGAFAGGADEVYVEDGHGGGKNFLPGKLDPRAKEIVFDDGNYAPASITCLMQVGMHAMAGTLNAFLDHTQSSVAWHDYYLNGRKAGELAQTAAYFGAYGVPCVMVSGDGATCLEARQFFGDIETAEVKTAVGRNSAHCLPDNEAERLIFEAAKRGMAKCDAIRPYKPLLPLEIRIEYNRSDYCDAVVNAWTDVERLDARTVRRVAEEIRTFADVLI